MHTFYQFCVCISGLIILTIRHLPSPATLFAAIASVVAFVDESSWHSPVALNALASHQTLSLAIGAHEDSCLRFYDIGRMSSERSMVGHSPCVDTMVAHMDAITSLAVDAHGLYLITGGKRVTFAAYLFHFFTFTVILPHISTWNFYLIGCLDFLQQVMMRLFVFGIWSHVHACKRSPITEPRITRQCILSLCIHDYR